MAVMTGGRSMNHHACCMDANPRRPMARLSGLSAYKPVLAQPQLRRLFPAFAISAVGDGMSAVAVAWLALRLAPIGERGIVVGAAVAAYALPGAAGAVLLFAFGALTVALYLALLTASSLMHAWGIAGRYTVVAEYLPETTRRAANALLSTFDMAALIVGPLLAGVVVALTNPALAIAVDAASFAVLAVAAWSSAPPPLTGARPMQPTGGRERGQGLRVITRTPALAALLALTLVFFLLYGPVEVALPLYVADRLGGGAGLLGWFWAVFGIGAVVGTLGTGQLRHLPLWPTVIASVVGWGAALFPLGLLHVTVIALGSFALGGFLYAPYTALSATLFQEHSPPALLSQVLAARSALTVLAAPLGTALGGPLVALIGASNTLLASGAATVLLGLIAAAWFAWNSRR